MEKYYSLILLISIFLISKISFFSLNNNYYSKFFFIGIFLHELSHIIVNTITFGKFHNISFKSCEKTNSVARVELTTNEKFASLVAVAPLIVLPSLIIILLEYFKINVNEINIFTSLKDFIIVYLSFVLLKSSELSSLDLKVYFENFFSVVNLFLIGSISYYVYENQNLINKFLIFLNQYENLFLNINLLLIILLPLSFFLKR